MKDACDCKSPMQLFQVQNVDICSGPIMDNYSSWLITFWTPSFLLNSTGYQIHFEAIYFFLSIISIAVFSVNM